MERYTRAQLEAMIKQLDSEGDVDDLAGLRDRVTAVAGRVTTHSAVARVFDALKDTRHRRQALQQWNAGMLRYCVVFRAHHSKLLRRQTSHAFRTPEDRTPP